MERETLLNSWKNAKKMDRIWMGVVVPGNNNREVRSLKEWKQYKAHELRLFMQHGAPVVTKDFVAKKYYKTICLASRIAYSCTKDSIAPADIQDLKDLCQRFMISFQKSFGISEVKYSVHLVSHLWNAVELYGPLHVVSCYGPEDQIGKITRKIKGWWC